MTKKEKVENINLLLRKSKFDLPDFRKKITKSGKNVHWLAKNIQKKNKVSDELMTLLNNF